MKLELTPPMMERLTAKIESAIHVQPPAVQAVYAARILAGNAILFTESTDGLRVLAAIEIDGEIIPVCDASYRELRGEGLN